jgi:hypothetical protein
MRINILSFKVVERYVLSDDNKFWKWLCGKRTHDKYHFDCIIRIDPESLIKVRGLEARKDFVQLPNKVRLQIWQINGQTIRAKTYKFIDEDLQKYRPIEMYLVYPHRHGHIDDRDRI